MRVIVIPANEKELMLEVDLESMAYPAINRLLEARQGTRWVERVQTPWLHALAQEDYDPATRMGGPRWPSVSMIVDEEGGLKPLPVNRRASVFYGGIIAGDAVLVGEDGGEDWIALPDNITTEKVAAVALEIIRVALTN